MFSLIKVIEGDKSLFGGALDPQPQGFHSAPKKM